MRFQSIQFNLVVLFLFSLDSYQSTTQLKDSSERIWCFCSGMCVVCVCLVRRGVPRGVSRGFRKPLWILHTIWNIEKMKFLCFPESEAFHEQDTVKPLSQDNNSLEQSGSINYSNITVT